MDAVSRLARLLELANSGPALRTALAQELEALLADWPSDCPTHLRGPCEAILAQVRPADGGDGARDALGATLIEMARANRDIQPRLAEALHLSPARIEALLRGPRGLAVIAKALAIPRATFSSLALLTGRNGELDLYEAVTEREIAALLKPDGIVTRAA